MTTGDESGVVQQSAARQGRALLYTVGGLLAGGAMLLDLLPGLAPFSSPLRVRACALGGALFLALGRFGSLQLRASVGKGWGRRR